MRYYVFILSFLFFLNSHAQIKFEDKIVNGSRVITAYPVFTDDPRYPGCWSFGIGASRTGVNKPMYVFFISITGLNAELLPENPGILIRLFDGQIMKLRAKEVQDIPNKNYAVSISLELSEAQLKLFNKGIKKIRIEKQEGYTEREYDEDIAGHYLYESYTTIKTQYAKPRQSFGDGF